MNLLSVQAVADRLGRDPSTVRRWCREGTLPGALRLGRDWMVPEKALEEWDTPIPRGRRFRTPAREELLGLARKYVWWTEPEQALGSPLRILAQAMELATWDDIARLEREAGGATLREVLRRARPGTFSPRSWHFWHVRLGLARRPGETPPLPRRAFLPEPESHAP